MTKIIAAFVGFIFAINMVFTPVSYAQVASLPAAGTMVDLTAKFNPAIVKGVKLYPDNPFKFDFIVDTGDDNLNPDQVKEQGQKIISYFLASLTTPEKEMWVNLSPYEKERIIPTAFGQTQMGTELLAQDYMLKQIMATALYPERELGKAFWQKVYAQAQAKFGTTNVSVNTFNKVWIVPSKAVVYENGATNSVFVVESSLKVMLEKDYVAANTNKALEQGLLSNNSQISDVSAAIIKEVVIPALEKEVNEGRNFAGLRQVYNSLILAAWYKNNLKNNVLAQAYVNRNKTTGVDVEDKDTTQKIYQQYLKAYRKGAYNYIKEDTDPVTKTVVARKYFSGGEDFALLGKLLETTTGADGAMRASQSMINRSFVSITAAALVTIALSSALTGNAVAATPTDNQPVVTVHAPSGGSAAILSFTVEKKINEVGKINKKGAENAFVHLVEKGTPAQFEKELNAGHLYVMDGGKTYQLTQANKNLIGKDARLGIDVTTQTAGAAAGASGAGAGNPPPSDDEAALLAQQHQVQITVDRIRADIQAKQNTFKTADSDVKEKLAKRDDAKKIYEAAVHVTSKANQDLTATEKKFEPIKGLSPLNELNEKRKAVHDAHTAQMKVFDDLTVAESALKSAQAAQIKAENDLKASRRALAPAQQKLAQVKANVAARAANARTQAAAQADDAKAEAEVRAAEAERAELEAIGQTALPAAAIAVTPPSTPSETGFRGGWHHTKDWVLRQVDGVTEFLKSPSNEEHSVVNGGGRGADGVPKKLNPSAVQESNAVAGPIAGPSGRGAGVVQSAPVLGAEPIQESGKGIGAGVKAWLDRHFGPKDSQSSSPVAGSTGWAVFTGKETVAPAMPVASAPVIVTPVALPTAAVPIVDLDSQQKEIASQIGAVQQGSKEIDEKTKAWSSLDKNQRIAAQKQRRELLKESERINEVLKDIKVTDKNRDWVNKSLLDIIRVHDRLEFNLRVIFGASSPDAPSRLAAEDVGGIDLEKTDVQTQGGGVKTAFTDPQLLRMLLNADGLVAVIYNIKPATTPMVNLLLGV